VLGRAVEEVELTEAEILAELRSVRDQLDRLSVAVELQTA